MKGMAIKFFAVLLALSFVAAGCKQEGKYTIGYAQTGDESDWRRALTKSMRAEEKKRGAVMNFSNAENKPENQIRAVRNFIAQKVDAIVISPIVETGWTPVLQEAKAAGIPVILLDRTVEVEDDSLFVCFIGSNFVEEGRMAADWLVKKMDGKANIVELQGEPGSAPATDRKVGFENVIQQHPGMKIIDSQTGMFRRSNGKEVMESFLKKKYDEGKIDVLYAHNDDMAIGAIQAIEAAGLKPGEDIIIVSIDAIKPAFEEMVKGKLNCTVECNPLLGALAFDAVEAVLAGKTLEKMKYMKDEVFDQSQAKDLIDGRPY